MKFFFAIIAILVVTLYLGFFLNFTEVYRDLGSSRTKAITSIAGIKSEIITENRISEFLTENGIKNPEHWIKFNSYRSGLFRKNIFDEYYGSVYTHKIKFFNVWLRQKLEKVNVSEKEMIVKPIVIKFIGHLSKQDEKGLKEVQDIISNDIAKESENQAPNK